MKIDFMINMQELLDSEEFSARDITREETREYRLLNLVSCLTECMNIWGQFKYPHVEVESLNTGNATSKKFLESYIEGLGYVLSVCKDDEVEGENVNTNKAFTMTRQFFLLLQQVEKVREEKDGFTTRWLLDMYVGIGELAGYTLTEIEEAFSTYTIDKVAVLRNEG
ncbi:dUTP diphosphatase [Bacillus mycoides]|uniref:dUTP diphosphatase n=1 Tax=Bacillus mycoides TaxID=1405 RepID=UPI003A80B270